MSAPELKPCPFCGVSPTYEEYIPGHSGDYIYCECGAEVGPLKGYRAALTKWNRRDNLPPTDAEVMAHPKVKALVEALRGLVPILCENVEDGCGTLSRHDCAACEGYATLAALERK